MTVYSLTGVIRPYAWGSHTAIAELQGRPAPTGSPEAELWLGAHPGDPSTVTGGASLLSLIAADPTAQLGEPVVKEFGPRLPYLMKVLAAEEPLSLQAHPDSEYAAAAFARQEADPSLPKNYVDAYHKPEMLVALTEFEGLCGFRAPAASAAEIASFGVARLQPVVDALTAGDLRTAVSTLLSWPADDRAALIAEVVAASGPGLVTMVAGYYPADPGVLLALLLNHVHLAPGEALWMPAGNLHAYLRGTGVEIMAASDNVLRGGFTPKRVDVGELLNVLVFEVLDEPVLAATPVSPGVDTWQVPVNDFVLYRLTLDGTLPPIEIPVGGPRILLATSGDLFAGGSVDGTPIEIAQGGAAYAPADAGAIKVAGTGRLFVAATPVA